MKEEAIREEVIRGAVTREAVIRGEIKREEIYLPAIMSNIRNRFTSNMSTLSKPVKPVAVWERRREEDIRGEERRGYKRREEAIREEKRL